MSWKIAIIGSAGPELFCEDEIVAREFLDLEPVGLANMRVYSSDEDGVPVNITEDFCARWFTDEGHGFVGDFDEWLSQYPRYFLWWYEDQIIDFWQSVKDEQDNLRLERMR
jgi:hypothetical protein